MQALSIQSSESEYGKIIHLVDEVCNRADEAPSQASGQIKGNLTHKGIGRTSPTARLSTMVVAAAVCEKRMPSGHNR